MLGTQYVIKDGDTLWDIAGKHLGDPMRWPEVHSYNNRSEVVAATGSKIDNPDLIFVGQKIFLPTGNTVRTPSASSPPAPNSGKKRALTKVRGIPFKYDLNNLPKIQIASPTFTATISLKGSVTLQPVDSVKFVQLTKTGYEIAAKKETDHAFGKLVNENKIGFNAATNEIKFECGLSSHSNIPNTLSTKASAGISSTGEPVIKGTIKAAPIKGKIGKHLYATSDLSIEIELKPRPPSAKPKPVPVMVPNPKLAPDINWDYLTGAGLIAGAAVLIIATIGEDIVTLGAGIVDDAPSFAAAAAMFAGGMAMFKQVNGGDAIQIEGAGIAPNQL
jgi:hypothetical protein